MCLRVLVSVLVCTSMRGCACECEHAGVCMCLCVNMGV